MSTLASGGKVWTVPKDNGPVAAVTKKYKAEFFRLLRFILPFSLIPLIVAIVLEVRVLTSKETGHISILGGYVEKYHSEMSPLILLIGGLILLGAVIVIVYCKATFPGEELAIPLILILPTVAYFIISTIINPAPTENSIDDWAKEKYGYESVSSFTNESNVARVEKADGSEISVGVLHTNDNFYFYENMTQLNELTTNLKALEDAK